MNDKVFTLKVKDVELEAFQSAKGPVSLLEVEALLQSSVHGSALPDWFVKESTEREAEGIGFLPFPLVKWADPGNESVFPVSDAVYALKYLVADAIYVLFQGKYLDEGVKSMPTPAVRVQSMHALQAEGRAPLDAVLDPHDHVISFNKLLALLLDDGLYCGGVHCEADGKYYALHPLLSLSPDQLWAHLRRQESLLALVQEYATYVLSNITADHVQWYEVHESYVVKGKLPWANRTISKDLPCPCCGMKMRVLSRTLTADHILDLVVGSNPYMLSHADPDLLICQGENWAAGCVSQINVPSGQLLFSDWIRHPRFAQSLKRENEYDTLRWHSINYPWGRLQESQFLASRDVAFGGIGNTTAEVYRFKEGIVLANIACEEDLPRVVKAEEGDSLRLVGTILTGLWAYTVVDKATVDSVIGSDVLQSQHLTILPVDATDYAEGSTVGQTHVEPGVYTHYYLKWLSVEEALAILPAHVQKLLAAYNFDTIYGVLLKNPS